MPATIVIDENADALDANYRQQASDRMAVLDKAPKTARHIDPNGRAMAEALTLLAFAADQAAMSLGDAAEVAQPAGIDDLLSCDLRGVAVREALAMLGARARAVVAELPRHGQRQ
jgi:hypothetical protein